MLFWGLKLIVDNFQWNQIVCHVCTWIQVMKKTLIHQFDRNNEIKGQIKFKKNRENKFVEKNGLHKKINTFSILYTCWEDVYCSLESKNLLSAISFSFFCISAGWRGDECCCFMYITSFPPIFTLTTMWVPNVSINLKAKSWKLLKVHSNDQTPSWCNERRHKWIYVHLTNTDI